MTKFSTIVRTGALAVIASGFVALSAPAFAADADALPRGELDVSTTDFTSSVAVDRLVKRLHHLAFNICAPDRFLNMATNASERECYNVALRNGMTQIEARRELALRASQVHVAVADPVAKPAH
jgi:UrcA family protein